jgi:hypothetical protein
MGCMVFTAESFAAAAKRIAALIYRYNCWLFGLWEIFDLHAAGIYSFGEKLLPLRVLLKRHDHKVFSRCSDKCTWRRQL